MSIKWEKDWEKKLQKAAKLPKEVSVNLDDSETKQLSDLEKQFKKTGGVVPAKSELRKILKQMKK